MSEVNLPPPTPRPPVTIPAHLHPEATPGRVRWWQFGSRARAKLWGLLLGFLTDGVTTIRSKDTDPVPLGRTPALPDGPLIVVANHQSHADSATLIATLGRSRPLRFVAAADYWLETPLTSWSGRALMGLWPVRRKHGGWDDLLKLAEPINAGVVPVIFPEGTRSRDGELGEFHSGAFRLAEATGAKVLPVALVGTGDALPVHGRPHRSVIEARWGDPIDPALGVDGMRDAARAQIEELREEPVANHPGFGWARVRRLAFGWVGLAIIFGWAFGEGVSWPLLAEMPLVLMIVTVGLAWRAGVLLAVSALGSLMGILATWWLVTHGIDPPTPFTTPRMHEKAFQDMATAPETAFWNQMWSGIPVKVYAHAAGEVGLDWWTMMSAAWARVLRIFIVGAVAWGAGFVLIRWLRPCLGTVQITGLVMFPFALAVVVWWWG